jgi:hypothetical protein
LTTDCSMVGAIPAPLGEERNSILPSVATGHQSEKREEMGLHNKFAVAITPSKLSWLTKVNLHVNRRYGEQANAKNAATTIKAGLGPKRTRIGANRFRADWYSPPQNPADSRSLQERKTDNRNEETSRSLSCKIICVSRYQPHGAVW